ncbi:MAG: leucine-rich repeat protein [Clostridia bacterium]|nr:leucine-rich repeat protein [Clostridia bacterium]
MKKYVAILLSILLCLNVAAMSVSALPINVFEYTITDGQATITAYNGIGGEVFIPATLGDAPVTDIADFVFAGMDEITEFKVEAENTAFQAIDGALLTKDGKELIAYPPGKADTAYTVPDGVTTIADSCFYYCQNLTTVTLPDSVAVINNCAFESCLHLVSVTLGNGVTTIGDWAFYECLSLTALNFPATLTSLGQGALSYCQSITAFQVAPENTVYQSIDDVLFTKDGKTLISYPAAKDSTSYAIPDGVVTLEEEAFGLATALTTIQIPDTVTTIGPWAFDGCENLASISIPNSVTTIGQAAFQNCLSLTTIQFPDGITVLEDYTFNGCENLVTVQLPEHLTKIGQYAFAYCSALYLVKIPDTVTVVADYAFYNCPDLIGIMIPETVIEIGEKAFGYCSTELGGVFTVDGFTIRGFEDSAAQTYAQENDFAFDIYVESECIIGDVDGDEKVTAADALEVLKSVVGKVTLTEKQTKAADVDGSGKVDAADALDILKKVVGKIEFFPIEALELIHRD